MSRELDILNWLTSEDTGQSSKTLAYRALGLRWRDESHPYDPADLNRCLLLMERLPWVRLHLPEMADVTPGWAALLPRWDELERMFVEEVGLGWTKGRSAPRTFGFMKALLRKIR